MLHFSRKTEVGLQVSSASTLQGLAAPVDLQPPVAGSSLQQHVMGAESSSPFCQEFLQLPDGMTGLALRPWAACSEAGWWYVPITCQIQQQLFVVQTEDTPPISQTDIQKAMEELVDTGVLPEVYEEDSIEDDLK